MRSNARRTIEAVYENGVSRPTHKVVLPERSRVRLTLVPLHPRGTEGRRALVERQRKALLSIAGIGASGQATISENPHQALYGTRRPR